MNDREVSWQCPNFEAPDATKLGFVRRAIEDGIKWNKDHIDEASMQKAIDILGSKTGSDKSRSWSKFTTGDLKRGVTEIVETLADIRPFWGYSTDNKAFEKHTDMMSKTAKAIYLESFVDRSLKDALQFGAATQCGFLHPMFSRDRFGSGEGTFSFIPLGQPDVLPVQLPRDRNYQRAYIVTLALPYGVAEAHARFPDYQAFLKPFAKKKYSRTKGGEDRRSYDQSRWKLHSLDSQIEMYCDIYFTYILDLRINYGTIDPQGKPIVDEQGNRVGVEMEMGQPGTSWNYKVPYVGQIIKRFENGREIERAATEDDCRVYPQRRLMISCDDALMYDGPGFDWHGMVPLIPFYFDKWAWGDASSLFDGTYPLQDAIDDLARSIYRVAMARARPGKVYNMDITSGDKNAKLTSKQAEGLDPFDPELTWGVDGDIKEPVLRPPMPEWCYNIPEWLFKVIDILQAAIQKQLGLDQIKALEKLRANVQDPEKALDAEGPVVMGTSRSMEMGLRDLGEMMKYLILQYKTTAEVMQYVGAESIAPEVFDYAPDSVIPSHLPGEKTIDDAGAEVKSSVDSIQRARAFAKNIKYFITPHSLHYIAQNKFKLNLLAAAGKGVVIDPETMAHAFEIPNWGSIDGATVKEKVFNSAKEQLSEKADIAKLEKALGLGQPEEGGKPGPAPGALVERRRQTRKPRSSNRRAQLPVAARSKHIRLEEKPWKTSTRSTVAQRQPSQRKPKPPTGAVRSCSLIVRQSSFG